MSTPETFDGISTITCGDVMLVMWKAPARLERTRWLGQRLAQAVEKNPEGLILAQFILSSSSPPDGPARAESSDTLKRHASYIRRMVTVPLGDAFWSNVVRAIMRGMLLLSGQSATHIVASSSLDAFNRIKEVTTPRTPSTAELVAALNSLYRALDVDAPQAKSA